MTLQTCISAPTGLKNPCVQSSCCLPQRSWSATLQTSAGTRLGNDRAAKHLGMFSLFCFRATVLSFPGKSCHARSSRRYAAKDLTKGSRSHVIGSGSSAITCKLMPRHLSAHWADAALLPSRCRRRSCKIHPTYDLSHLRDIYKRAGFRDSQVTSPSIVTSKSRWGADARRIVCCCQR